MKKARIYRSGTSWCVWRWTVTDSEYIVRLHILKTPWFAVCLHWIKKPDPEPYLHDHPVSFISIILRGGYEEKKGCGWYRTFRAAYLKRNWNERVFNFIRADRQSVHRIVTVEPNTLTLVFMGPKVREWGFHTPDGWVHWKDYYMKQRAAKISGPR
jgi:hypothetical protein